MDSLLKIKELYQNYCHHLKNETIQLRNKMNQSFDASIQNYNPEEYDSLPTLEFYQTKEVLENKTKQFRNECRFFK
jgi:hypothetical protein